MEGSGAKDLGLCALLYVHFFVETGPAVDWDDVEKDCDVAEANAGNRVSKGGASTKTVKAIL